MPVDWNTASDEDVIRAYRDRFGGDVTATSGFATSGLTPDQLRNINARMGQALRATAAQRGVGLEQMTQADYVAAGREAGLSQDDATRLAQNVYNFRASSGRLPNNYQEWEGIAQAVDIGREPTLPREEFDENRRRFDVTQGNWGREFDESTRRFNVNTSGWTGEAGSNPTLERERMYSDLFSRLSGPQDWVRYQIAQSGMPEGSLGEGGLAEAFARTPAFGAVQADPANSWENRLGNLWTQTRQTPPTDTVPAQPPSGGPTPQPGGVQTLYNNQPFQGTPTAADLDPRGMRAQSQPGAIGRNPIGPDGQPAAQQNPMVQGGGRNPIGPDGQPAAQQNPMVQGGSQYNSQSNPWQMTRQQTTGQTPSYEQLAEQLGRRQPTEISRVDLNRMTPTQRAMQEGAWSAASLNPQDMWERTRRAQPQGTANTRTRWT